MDAWIFFTFGAVVFQTLRFMIQKVMAKGGLSAAGATFARFFFAAPIVWIACAVAVTQIGMPQIGTAFPLFVVAGAISQILATVCVVLLLQSRNFAVGITFKKSEVIMTVLVGLVILGEGVSLPGLIAILLGMSGVLVLSDPPEGMGRGLRSLIWNRAVGLGLASGAMFAVSAVTYRGATLEVAADPIYRTIFALSAVITVQILTLGLWLRLREPGEITRVALSWRRAGWIGLMSLGGSICWFTAFTLQNASYVNALGQVEVILSLLASVFFFREKISRREILGIALITLSVLVLVLVT